MDCRGASAEGLATCDFRIDERTFRGSMNRKQISALLVLRELGIQHHMGSFSDRLRVQKSVYLAQEAGVDLGHHYSWYLRGPYSPTLTQDVFDAIENHEPDAVLPGWELDSATRERLSTLRTAFSHPNLTESQWLELLASTHFLISRRQVAECDATTLQTQLKKFRKDFSESQVQDALDQLQAAGLLPVPI